MFSAFIRKVFLSLLHVGTRSIISWQYAMDAEEVCLSCGADAVLVFHPSSSVSCLLVLLMSPLIPHFYYLSLSECVGAMILSTPVISASEFSFIYSHFYLTDQF